MTNEQPEKWQVLASEVVMHDAFLTIEMQQLTMP